MITEYSVVKNKQITIHVVQGNIVLKANLFPPEIVENREEMFPRYS